VIKTFKTAAVGDKVVYVTPEHRLKGALDRLEDVYGVILRKNFNSNYGNIEIQWNYNDIPPNVATYYVTDKWIADMHFYTQDCDLLVIKLKGWRNG
jgi:hypothetical protein